MNQQAMYEELRSLGAATVYEAQGAKGALDSGIKPIDPASRLIGPALTVDTRPADNLMLHYALSKARPGDVLVVDAKGFLEAGPWGDVLTIAAMKVGVAGLVINGAVRDADAIVEMGFPVFCRGLSIKGTGKVQPGKVNVPICIGDVVILGISSWAIATVWWSCHPTRWPQYLRARGPVKPRKTSSDRPSRRAPAQWNCWDSRRRWSAWDCIDRTSWPARPHAAAADPQPREDGGLRRDCGAQPT